MLSAKEPAKQMKARDRQISNLSHKDLNMAHITFKIFGGICLFTVPMLSYSYFLFGTVLSCEFKSPLHAQAQHPDE